MSTLKGDLSAFGLPELFQHLSQNKKYGILRIYHEEQEKKLIFQANGITLLSSGDRKSKEIGKLLVFHRIISLAQLEQALSHQRRSKSKSILGQTLIELGFVQLEDISRVMLDQIKEEIYDLFTWEKANFEFIEDLREVEKLHLDPNLIIDKENIAGTILEAMQRIDEWKVIQEDIPSMHTIYVPANIYLEDLVKIRSEEALRHVLNSAPTENSSNMQIFALVDGRNTVEDIVQKSYMPRFEVFIELCNLIRQSFIRPATAHELVSICQVDPEDKQRKSMIYAYAYPMCYQDPMQFNCTLEILKYFQENPSLHPKFPFQIKQEVLRIAQIYMGAKDLESARYLLKLSWPQFNQEEDYSKLYLDILAHLKESDEALTLLYPLIKKLNEQGEFRKLNQYYNLAKTFDPNHPLLKKIKALRSSPERKFSRTLILTIVICVAIFGGLYYHLYQKTQQESSTLFGKLTQETNGMKQDYRVRMEECFRQKNYSKATLLFREMRQNKDFIEQALKSIEDFLSKNKLFFVQSQFQELFDTLTTYKTTFKTQLSTYETKLNEIRVLILDELEHFLKQGRLSAFLEKMRESETLFITYIDYELLPEPKLRGFYPEGQFLNEAVKSRFPILMSELGNVINNHKRAEAKLDEIQKSWNNAIQFKNSSSFKDCLSAEREMLYKIPETDFHRQVKVPFLIFPSFDEETEPELARNKELSKNLKIQFENAQAEQEILLDNKTSYFLCSYSLPIHSTEYKPLQIQIQVEYPGFKPVQESFSQLQLISNNQLSYAFSLRRKHTEYPFSNLTHLLEYRDMLLCVSEDGGGSLIRAVDLEGKERWTLPPFYERIVFSPTLYKDYLIVGTSPTNLESELNHFKLAFYKLNTLSGKPEEEYAITVEGGVRTSICIFSEQNLMCFGSLTRIQNRLRGCVRFYSLSNLSEVFPPIPVERVPTTGIAHNAKDSIYFGVGQNFYAYSLNTQKNTWKESRSNKLDEFVFQPFTNAKSVGVILNTTNGNFFSFDLDSGKVLKPLYTREKVLSSPQISHGIVSITTPSEILGYYLKDFETFCPRYTSSAKISGSAVSDGRYVYFVTEDGDLYAILPKSDNSQGQGGEIAWKYSLKKELKDYSGLSGPMMIYHQRLFLPLKQSLIVFELAPSS